MFDEVEVAKTKIPLEIAIAWKKATELNSPMAWYSLYDWMDTMLLEMSKDDECKDNMETLVDICEIFLLEFYILRSSDEQVK